MKKQQLNDATAVPVAAASTRYLVNGLENDFGHIIVLGATVVGAFLGFDNADLLCSYFGVKHSLFSSLACAGLGAAVANLLVQMAYYMFTKLMQPFVPDSWIAE